MMIQVVGALSVVITNQGGHMNVNLIAQTSPQNFPTGTLGAGYNFQVKTPAFAVVKNVTIGGLSVSFTDLAPGDYITYAQRQSAAGAPLGIQASKAFTVPDPGVMIDAVSTMDVVLS